MPEFDARMNCRCENPLHPHHLGISCVRTATRNDGYCHECFQKCVEYSHLSRFKAAFKGFPLGDITYGTAGSEPDFFVSTDTGLLGIELTRLYRTPDDGKRPRQEGESIREQIVEEARLIYERQGWPSVDVFVVFSFNQDWSKRRVPFLASRIAALVFRHALREVQGAIRLENHWTDADHFPYEVAEVRIFRSPQSHWSTGDAEWMPDFDVAEIQTRIDEKNLRVPIYRQKNPEQLWLLIVHQLKPSSWFKVSEALKQPYTTSFDCVFTFDAFGGTYVKLDTTEPNSSFPL